MSKIDLYKDNYWSYCMREINKKYKLDISRDTSFMLAPKFIKIGFKIFYARPFIAIDSGWYMMSIFVKSEHIVVDHGKIENIKRTT